MNFEINNFGKIVHANIRVDGITVVAGPNGSGKSTISRALMTWCSVIRRMGSLSLFERMKSVRDAVNEVLAAHDLASIRFPIFHDIGWASKFLVPEVWHNPEMVFKLVNRGIDSYRRRYGQETVALADKIVGLYDEISPRIEQIARKEDSDYASTIVEDSFNRAFDDELASFTSSNEPGLIRSVSGSERIRSCTIERGHIVSLEGVEGNHAPLSFYLEPIHIFDFFQGSARWSNWDLLAENRYQAGEEDWGRLILRDVDMAQWSVERKEKHRRLERELHEIMDVIRGQMVNVDRMMKFHDLDVNADISIRNVASGAKSMAIVARGLRSGVVEPGSLLIIDEPESNLHPAWQISFAKFLALLERRFDFKIFVNTHSPYFMRAIDVFSRDLQCPAERKAFYRMVGEGTHFAADDVTANVNVVFEDLYRPLERVM